jgi:FkbM family methyltransferase
MNSQVSQVFRSVQVYFPFLQDYRFQLQRSIRSLLQRPHEKDFEVLSLLPKSSNNLFIDIGANRGEAIQSVLLKRPDARVVAFEPNSYLFNKLKHHYRSDRRIELYNVGLGSSTGSFQLNIPFYNNYMFDGLASFKEENARDWLKDRLYGYQSSKLDIRKQVCLVRPLDDLKLNPYFIKIDVQGFEYEVLLGAKKTIAESKPVLLIETPQEPELDFLRSLGYACFVYQQDKLVPGTKGLNVFFIPEKMRSLLKLSDKLL